VTAILVEGNKAKGVQLADGRTYLADMVISGAGILNTYEKFLPKEVNHKYRLDEKLKKLSPSVAHVCLYIGLNGTPENLKLPKANYWIYPEDVDHDEATERYANDIEQPLPVVYISFPSAKDPSWSERYPDKSTIDIIAPMPYAIFEKWSGTKWKKRGEEYEEFKEKIAQRLLAELYKQEPQVQGKIDCYELSSPITTQHFMNYDLGELYGIDHNPERYEQRFLQPRTPIKNLFLTGQDIVTCGVGGALLAGYLTASTILKKNVIKDVLKNNAMFAT